MNISVQNSHGHFLAPVHQERLPFNLRNDFFFFEESEPKIWNPMGFMTDKVNKSN